MRAPRLVLAILVALTVVSSLSITPVLADQEPRDLSEAFESESDADVYQRAVRVLDALWAELRRVTTTPGLRGVLYRLTAVERLRTATEDARRVHERLRNDPQLFSSVNPRAVDLGDLIAEVEAAIQRRVQHEAFMRSSQGRRVPRVLGHAMTAFFETHEALLTRLREHTEAAIERQRQSPSAPTEPVVSLPDSLRLWLAEDDEARVVWETAKEAGFWNQVVARDDLTPEQRERAEKRAAAATAALEVAVTMERVVRRLPPTLIRALAHAGLVSGQQAASASNPSLEPADDPVEDLPEDGQPEAQRDVPGPESPEPPGDETTGNAHDQLDRTSPRASLEPATPVTEADETTAGDTRPAGHDTHPTVTRPGVERTEVSVAVPGGEGTVPTVGSTAPALGVGTAPPVEGRMPGGGDDAVPVTAPTIGMPAPSVEVAPGEGGTEEATPGIGVTLPLDDDPSAEPVAPDPWNASTWTDDSPITWFSRDPVDLGSDTRQNPAPELPRSGCAGAGVLATCTGELPDLTGGLFDPPGEPDPGILTQGESCALPSVAGFSVCGGPTTRTTEIFTPSEPPTGPSGCGPGGVLAACPGTGPVDTLGAPLGGTLGGILGAPAGPRRPVDALG